MSKRRYEQNVTSLGRFLIYILGHRPDEFGLLPDGEGFVSYKELLKAIHEEPEWRHVSRGHINEVLLGKDRFLFVSEENRIRAAERRWPFSVGAPCEDLPKLLYVAVRRKAHRSAVEKGLWASESAPLVFSPDEETALRIGRRRDAKPVALKVTTASALKEGILFSGFGKLFLASVPIPAKHVVAPPLPKEAQEDRTSGAKKERELPRPPDFSPGSFILDASRDPDPSRQARGKKPKGWKEAARKIRRGRRS